MCVSPFVTFLFLFFFYCWYLMKESYMETRPMENFISLPYTSSNVGVAISSLQEPMGYFKISLSKLPFCVVFLKVYLLKRSALNLLQVKIFIWCFHFSFFLELKFKEQTYRVHQGWWNISNCVFKDCARILLLLKCISGKHWLFIWVE